MNNEEREQIVKEIIEYANAEIAKSKKKHLKILLVLFASLASLAILFFLVFRLETPISYEEGMIAVEDSEDNGLDIEINLSNYRNAKARLVQLDENTYDLYINITQTPATGIFKDSDDTDHMLRVGNNIVVDFQSGSVREYIPEGYSVENIMHIYYIDTLSSEIMVKDDIDLVKYENKILIWTRE